MEMFQNAKYLDIDEVLLSLKDTKINNNSLELPDGEYIITFNKSSENINGLTMEDFIKTHIARIEKSRELEIDKEIMDARTSAVLQKCEGCNEKFPIETDYLAHKCIDKEIIDASTSAVLKKCEGCNEKFSIEKDYVAHKCIDKEIMDASTSADLMKCEECIEKFPTEQDYLAHKCIKREEQTETEQISETLDKQLNKGVYSCANCKELFSRNRDLLLHIEKVHHNTKINKKNRLDGQANKDNNKLIQPKTRMLKNRRQSMHTDERKIKKVINVCEYCQLVFSSVEQLMDHRERHLLNSKPVKMKSVKNICANCKKEFSSTEELINHRKGNLKVKPCTRSPIKYPCEQCGKMCSVKLLAQHKHLHSDIKRYKCDLCGISYKNHSSVKNHFLSAHDNKKTFICDKCPKSFNTRNLLRSHFQKMHADPSTWKHICPVCNKHFFLKAELTHHIDDHNKTYLSCAMCGDTFKSKDRFEIHKDTCIVMNSVYPCDMCVKMFISETGLLKHKKKCILKNALYKCSLCNEKFISQDTLHEHKEECFDNYTIFKNEIAKS